MTDGHVAFRAEKGLLHVTLLERHLKGGQWLAQDQTDDMSLAHARKRCCGNCAIHADAGSWSEQQQHHFALCGG